MANPAATSVAQTTNGSGAKTPRIPFTRASRELTEPGMDESLGALAASAINIPTQDVPSVGWLRSVILDVQASGGDDGATPAVAAADAPFSVLSDISFMDVNGQPLVGPFSGYDLYLVNKYGGYTWDSDPINHPGYVAPDTNGDFRFFLRLPLEIVGRDALGALPNQNSAAAYKVRGTIADETGVYATSPGTTNPSVRVRSHVEAWSQPNPTAPSGAENSVTPPYVGTVQYWNKQVYNVSSGAQTIRFNRVGNLFRNLILVWRDSSGVRQNGTFPDPVSVYFDGQPIFSSDPKNIRDGYTRERYGFDPDTGVVVYPFTHDFDGHPGNEMKDLWMPSMQSSRLEIRGTFGEAGTLSVLTNDIRPNTGGVA